jgi:hypothetical protein
VCIRGKGVQEFEEFKEFEEREPGARIQESGGADHNRAETKKLIFDYPVPQRSCPWRSLTLGY